MLLEMQHRVFNSLQVIANILMMKTRIVTSDEARQHLEDAYSRVLCIANLQRHIDTAGRSETVEIVPYISTLCDSITASIIGDDKRIAIKYTLDPALIPSEEAVSLGLIITELIINSVKYAFPEVRQDAEILIKYQRSGSNWRLAVSDNGVGESEKRSAIPGLGSTLVKALAEQIQAKVETTSSASTGHAVTISHATFTPRPEQPRSP